MLRRLLDGNAAVECCNTASLCQMSHDQRLPIVTMLAVFGIVSVVSDDTDAYGNRAEGETSAPPRTRFPFQLPVDELDVVEAHNDGHFRRFQADTVWLLFSQV